MSDDSTPVRAKTPEEAMAEAVAAMAELRSSTAPAAEALRRASCAVIDAAQETSRASRRASGSMPVVRPGKPQSGDTGRYAVLRDAAESGLPIADGGLRT